MSQAWAPSAVCGPKLTSAFAHALAGAQFGRVVVQRELGRLEYQQQAGLLELRLSNPVIELLIARDGREDTLELGGEPHFFGRTGGHTVG